MKYVIYSHRFGYELTQQDSALMSLWSEIRQALDGITDDRLASEFQIDVAQTSQMSLSKTINRLLQESFSDLGWTQEAAIFQDPDYSTDRRWRLDFSKAINNQEGSLRGVAVEVAFNHGEAIAWNLLKPVIASELNHVKKQIDLGAGVGVVICATEDLKSKGAFDSAVGSFERFLTYMKPLQNQLSVPMVVIGLQGPSRFRVTKRKNRESGRNEGQLELS